MFYLFTSESVSEGHPDKIADQISDTVLDNFLAFDPDAKVACETLVTTGQVILAGEVKSKAYIDVQTVARNMIQKIGYTKSDYMFEGKSCGVLSTLHEQSPEISQGIEKKNKITQGAGDQGMMFGYAIDETPQYIPLPLYLSHTILRELAEIRKQTDLMPYLRPDAKSQVTVAYNANGTAQYIDTIVLSTQHDPFDKEDKKMLAKIKADVLDILIPRVRERVKEEYIKKMFTDRITYHINPTGKFIIGGPHGDTGLTGRKIIVDTYGGKGAHGGGAFSGKDPSKVDRSGAYAARHVAKNLVAAGVCKEVLVQIAYAIGIAKPVGFYVNTFGTAKINMSDAMIARKIVRLFDFRPYAIEQYLRLRFPIYSETAVYGHFGRTPQIVEKQFRYSDGKIKKQKVELFTWEKLDYVATIKKAFNLV